MDENGTVEIENVTIAKTDHIDKNGDNYTARIELMFPTSWVFNFQGSKRLKKIPLTCKERERAKVRVKSQKKWKKLKFVKIAQIKKEPLNFMLKQWFCDEMQ